MAIATAALLGYELAVNFDAPYFSTSVREFWQRWHISLSTWLRDYLYIPLGGNRGGRWFAARNLMLTMLLGGLWHGANWTFIVWGFLHGAALVVHRFWSARAHAPARGTPVPRWKLGLGWAATFGWVVLCFTIFRCANIGVAWTFLVGVTRAGPSALPPSLDWWPAILALGACHYLIHRHRAALRERMHRVHDFVFYPALGAATALLLSFTPSKAAAFIYFQF
jgi:alginate O-acetyltransferase complex protein AlgI